MMTVVVDANVYLALALPLPYSRAVVRQMKRWQEERTLIVVPALWEYEIVSGLRKACVIGLLTSDGAIEALLEILSMQIEVIGGTPDLHQRALKWAEQLDQSRAYDAQYLALAEQLRAELWTADRRLVNRAHQVAATWVHWIGEN